MFSDDGDFSILLHLVVHDIKLVEGTVDQFAVPVILPFDNLHDFTAAVFQLLGEHHNRIGFHHDLHQNIVRHVVFSLGERHHPAVGGLRGVGVDGGDHRMPGTGAFRYG